MATEQQRPAGSRFAVTCGMLRQYMKEQGGSGATRCLAPAVAMGLMPEADAAVAAATEERTTVLELFPQQAGTLKDEQQRKRKEPADGRAPLTIFYGGKMVVFDDFPAEKAEELMQLAGSGGNTAPAAAAQNALGQPSLTDMPLARKVSLKRFLEKRKNRLTAADPYPAAAASESSTKQPSAVKDEGAPWLGVGSALSLS
ncbi:unnamed protein product [Miscanthus lutarioriparius]|uniref:Protein TIFY n=1 Tax=Miscanthus lutarioriparius TaxID=422564 RepID=A0A811M2S2_9POAL|nr:unnamed protein product [Miscanthus lutarioriparius]